MTTARWAAIAVVSACATATTVVPRTTLCAQAAPAAAQTPAAAPATVSTRVQAGSIVRPDTVTVGDPFTFIVSVAVPQNARVEWAGITDTSAWVAQTGAVKIIDEGNKLGVHRERAEYTLTAWNVGEQKLGVPDATVRLGGAATKVPLGEARVFVRSVLPADTAQHIPKPARDLFQRVVPWWQQWWPVLVVLALLAALWWLWRRRRRRLSAPSQTPTLNAFQRAMHEFERLERLHLADAGESGRYVALATDILRLYLATRVPNAVLSLTSAELLLVALEDDRVPRDRLISLLADADGVKFAARAVTPARARELAAESRGVVTEIERAEQARRAAAEAARQAAVDAEERSRAEAEDAARKASRQPRDPKGGPRAGAR
jgi:hypothetical protein